MKSKRNAFTLIELLAIIVILAIIAVITVPIILNIIDNSKKGAATDSAYGYKDAVNKYYVTELSDNNNLKLEGEYTVSNGSLTGKFEGSTSEQKTVPISVSGDKPSSGYLNYSNNTLTSGCLVFGDYAVTFDGSTTSTVKGTCSLQNNNEGNGEGETSQGGESQTYTVYSLGEEVTVGGEKFFVIAEDDSSKSKVTLLAKYNLNQDGTEQLKAANSNTKCIFSGECYWLEDAIDYYYGGAEMWKINGDVDEDQLTSSDFPSLDYYTWLGNPEDIPNGWNTSYEDVGLEELSFPDDFQWYGIHLNLNNISGYSDGDSIKKAKDYATSVESGAIGRLLTFEEADLIDNGDNADLKVILHGTYTGTDKVPTSGFLQYWLSSPGVESADPGAHMQLWYINKNGFAIGDNSISTGCGVRPVIEISKSSIE